MTSRAFAWAALLTLLGACASAPPNEPWRELFDGRHAGRDLGAFTATDFGGQGDVAVRDGRLCLGIGSPLTGVTWTGPAPSGAYEMELVGRRDDGIDFWCGLTFPVGDAHLTLVLGGWGGSLCGLSSLDGNDAAHNDTRVLRSFADGVDHRVHLTVRPERVEVIVDEQPLLAADLRGHTIGLRPEVLLSRPLGVASFTTAASFAQWRWRPMASGDPVR